MTLAGWTDGVMRADETAVVEWDGAICILVVALLTPTTLTGAPAFNQTFIDH